MPAQNPIPTQSAHRTSQEFARAISDPAWLASDENREFMRNATDTGGIQKSGYTFTETDCFAVAASASSWRCTILSTRLYCVDAPVDVLDDAG
jgi:hypothetical protein